jgi:hypothetical protein
MTAHQATAAPRRSAFLPVRWLISPRADLTWLIGSVTLSYALFFAWRAGLLSTMSIVLLWVFVFHGPHFWGTISRTFLDPTEQAAVVPGGSALRGSGVPRAGADGHA